MDYPVSNEVYNMLSMLTNKLQALEAYDHYSKDMDSDGRDLVKRIAQDDRQHVEQLINQLETHIRANGMRPKK
jgi:hypothetical protein